MRCLLFVLVICFAFEVSAQLSVARPDSLLDINGFFQYESLEYDEYMEAVRSSSLMSIVAENTRDYAEAGLDAATGIYDPFLRSDFLSKNYTEKNYYNLGTAEISQFTPFGLSIHAGLEHNTGEYVDPQNTVPLGGLGYLGIELPLLNGLLTDERRTNLKLAANAYDQSQFDRQSRYNDLGEAASNAYWMWWRSRENLLILDSAIKAAKFRLRSVRSAVIVGDKPALDTLDAQNQVFTWRNEFAMAYSDYIKARNNAVLYAGIDTITNGNPVGTVLEQVIENNIVRGLDMSLDTIALNNPQVRISDFKIQSLEIERELKKQKLLPKLTAKYNVLAQQFNYGDETDKVDNLFTESIKWGLKFEYPLFITQARNELSQNSIKLETTQAERDFKAESIRRKVESYVNEIEAIEAQIANYTVSLSNYQKLVELERIRYQNGDGSLFLINYREFKLYEAKIKLVEYKAKLMLKLAALSNAVGFYKITDLINE